MSLPVEQSYDCCAFYQTRQAGYGNGAWLWPKRSDERHSVGWGRQGQRG